VGGPDLVMPQEISGRGEEEVGRNNLLVKVAPGDARLTCQGTRESAIVRHGLSDGKRNKLIRSLSPAGKHWAHKVREVLGSPAK